MLVHAYIRSIYAAPRLAGSWFCAAKRIYLLTEADSFFANRVTSFANSIASFANRAIGAADCRNLPAESAIARTRHAYRNERSAISLPREVVTSR